MAWQQYKDNGKYICIVVDNGSWCSAHRERRVIHSSTAEIKIRSLKCVRYKNCWHPIHLAEEWTEFLKNLKSANKSIILSWPLTRYKKDAIPFLLDWEESGTLYQVFGY